MGKKTRGRAGATVLLTVIAVLSPYSVQADLLVLNSTVPDLKAGQVLSENRALTLPPGSIVTLLTQDGRTVHATGPWSGTLEAARSRDGDPRMVTVLSRLLQTSPADQTSLGVTRGVDLRGPFTIRPEGGAHCQVAGMVPTFERDPVSHPDRLTITDGGGGQVMLDWPAEFATLPWPRAMPFRDGTYTLLLGMNAKPVTLTVHQVPVDLQTTATTAVWMSEHGCAGQARALLATIQ